MTYVCNSIITSCVYLTNITDIWSVLTSAPVAVYSYRPRSMEDIHHPGWALNCYCSCSFVRPSLQSHRRKELKGDCSRDNTDWITLHLVRVQVWVTYYRQGSAESCRSWRTEARYCCLFCDAVIDLNVSYKLKRALTNLQFRVKESKMSIRITPNHCLCKRVHCRWCWEKQIFLMTDN